ncbi:DUF2244 domain-containing protein [Woodsholea maritima]|uniref:DUF2244 domain-containing protein n=1 Tax=Woodsholea maritima TaxID=240237 RepID=UPI00039A9AA0|nr:DUF2244 domain-containing protein [Woodsholea maritima]
MMERRFYESWPREAEPLAPLADPLLFDGEVRPHRSLPSLGFIVVMATLVAMSFTAGLAFWLIGAWPVIGFFGLDIALVWLAFKLSYRDGRQLEKIEVTRAEIRVSRFWPSGHFTQYRMPTGWCQLSVRGKGQSDVQICLSQQGKHLIVGTHLSPQEREDLGQALQSVLARARRADFNPLAGQ